MVAALFLFNLLAVMLMGQTADTISYVQYLRSGNQAAAIQLVGKNISGYYEETGQYPVSLTALAATPGYESAKGVLNKYWLNYGLATGITESPWRFDRAAVFVLSDNRRLTPSQYLAAAENACGAGDFNSSSWCGNKESLWLKFESRHSFLARAGDQQKALDGLINRIVRYYNQQGDFPKTKDDASVMAAGDVDTLASIVGYAGSANACSGIFDFESIPFGCNDLFGRDGNPIKYHYISSSRIAMTVETNLLDDSGNKVVLGSTVQAP